MSDKLFWPKEIGVEDPVFNPPPCECPYCVSQRQRFTNQPSQAVDWAAIAREASGGTAYYVFNNPQPAPIASYDLDEPLTITRVQVDNGRT